LLSAPVAALTLAAQSAATLAERIEIIVNIMLLLEMASGAEGGRVAVGDRQHGVTFVGLYDMAARAAALIRDQGSQRVLYTDESSIVLPVALFGAAWAGVPFVPLNYRLADERLRSVVARQAPALLLCGEGTEHRFEGIDGVDLVSGEQFLASLEQQTPADADWSQDPEAVAVLLHTSGTSGEPKAAVLRHRHLVNYVLGSVEFLSAGADEASLVSVPPYHIAGVSAVLTSVYNGRRLVQLPAFDPHEWVRLARDQQITHAMTVPTMLARILDALDETATGGVPSLRHLAYGGGRMPIPVIERAMAAFPGVDFVNAYGLTETSSSIAVLGPDDHRSALTSNDPSVRQRLGSVGRPLPTVEISIRDPHGESVPDGQRGEVWVRGEQVSGEYANRTGDDTEGWFATHDGGWFDSDGFLYVEGRLDDVIVRGGENLSPGEIEDVLLAHGAVSEAVVVGVPDEEWGEAVAAVVVLHVGASATPDELSEWVVAHLRSSRRPAVLEIHDQLPYSDTGKVLRRVVREELGVRAR